MDEIKVQTPAGEVTAKPTDSDYPGIRVEVDGLGVAYVEYDKDKGKLQLVIYDGTLENDEPIMILELEK